MSDYDSFEDRVRAIADEISRSMQRMSEVDLDKLAESYGVDADRARNFASAAGQWLNERLSGEEPLFGQDQAKDHSSAAPGPNAGPDVPVTHDPAPGQASTRPGPHPLDLPDGWQGLALSALDSGRWSVRAGSNQLAGTGEGSPPPSASVAQDLVSDLRARDWITADGTLTSVGRHALARWCRTADAPPAPPPHPDPAPPQA